MYQEIIQFQQPAIRDMVWFLLSPDLISQWSDPSWNQEQYQQSKKFLLELDKQPHVIEQYVKPWPQVILGKYVEALWSLWLHQNPRYKVIYENLQIHNNKITIGEFDYIIKDLQTNRTEHWEIALKVFLGYGDTSTQNAWYGLKFKDRLDIKVDRLANHQTQLSKRPEAAEFIADKGLKIDKVRVIFKGQLYYPEVPENCSLPNGSNPCHLKAQWWPLDKFLAHPIHRSLNWEALHKGHWMAPKIANGSEVSIENFNPDLPTMIAGFKNKEESSRIFLVPNNWALPNPL